MSDKKSSVILLDRLQKTLLKIGNTNEEIAAELGCDHSTINKWYNGKLTPSFDKIVSICKKANVSIDYLCGFREEPTNNTKISDICDYIHLSEETVEHLHTCSVMIKSDTRNNSVYRLPISDCDSTFYFDKYTKYYPMIQNEILTQPCFFELISTIVSSMITRDYIDYYESLSCDEIIEKYGADERIADFSRFWKRDIDVGLFTASNEIVDYIKEKCEYLRLTNRTDIDLTDKNGIDISDTLTLYKCKEEQGDKND